MIKLRPMAAAYLYCGDDWLMMQRSPSARFFPDHWAPVGGHLEADEIADPTAACLREIWEETGLVSADLTNLSLRYIVHRLCLDEIRIQYVFFGSVSKREVCSNDEGELHWVHRLQLLTLKTSVATRFILERYLSTEAGSGDGITLGTIGAENGQPTITWTPLLDWE